MENKWLHQDVSVHDLNSYGDSLLIPLISENVAYFIQISWSGEKSWVVSTLLLTGNMVTESQK